MVVLRPENYELVGRSGMQGFRRTVGDAEAINRTPTQRYPVNARVNAVKHDDRVRRPDRAGGAS